MKETYYFPHDFEPTSDPKISAMIGVYGAVGYGLYWRLIEMLHSDESHKLPVKQYIYISLSKQMLTAVEQCSTLLPPVETVQRFVDDCITLFELFESDGSFFWSNRVNRNIEKRENEKSNKSNAGKASAEKRRLLNLTAVQQTSTPVEQNPTKERKGKESKGKERKEKIEYSLTEIPSEWHKALRMWTEYKHSRNESYKSQQSFNALYERLVKLSSGNPSRGIDIVNRSMANNWAGLFELDKSEIKTTGLIR